jgi:DNA-binding NarL/FixJ family response regulator
MDGMRVLLKAVADFKVVGEASDGEMVLKLVQEVEPDVILLDWSLSRQKEMQVLRNLMATGRSIRTLLFTVFPDNEQILQALTLGVWGVVMKDSSTQMLYNAIYKVSEGQYWIGREGVASLVEALRGLAQFAHPQRVRSNYGLTPREFEVIAAIVAGYSNLDISESLSVSEHTVKHHLGHIFDKLGVSNRLELALFAVNHQLIGESR